MRPSSCRHVTGQRSLLFTLLTLCVWLLAACGSDSDGNDDNNGGGGSDTQPPTITASVSPAANAAGWHNDDVTVSFDCADAGSGVATCPGAVVVDTEGGNQAVSGTATDVAGNSASTSVTVNLDKTPPELAEYDPADGETVLQPGINLTGTVNDSLSGTTSVTCADDATTNEAVLSEGSSVEELLFGCSLPLVVGEQAITVAATDLADNVVMTPLSITHIPLPEIAIDAPELGSVASMASTLVTGTIDDPSATVRVNGMLAAIAAGRFEATVPLDYGINTLTAVAENAAGTAAAQVRLIAVYGNQRPPIVQLTRPLPDFVIGGETGTDQNLLVTGWVRDNRVAPGALPPEVSVTVEQISPDTGAVIATTTVDAVLAQQELGLCTTEDVCWRFDTATMLPAGTPLRLEVTAVAETGSETANELRSGAVDYCFQNNGDNNASGACEASLAQRAGCTQSRRCIENSDGCPVAFGEDRNDPTGGVLGLVSTAFGVVEDPGTAAGEFTVFGEERGVALPCNQHDECYHQWCPTEGPTRAGVVAEKQACNLRFEQNLLALCRSAYPEFSCPEQRIGADNCEQWSEEKNLCLTNARLYYTYVVEDADRYLVAGTHYDEYPYGGFLTPVAGCPAVQ